MILREMEVFDIDAVVNLMHQLGYAADNRKIRKRLSHLKPLINKIVIAESGRKVVGLIHLQLRVTLMDDRQVEIVSLVVDEAWRGKGVGKRLLTAAQDWAVERGLPKIQLYSNQKRTAAHAFYMNNGYQKIKDSIMLVKEIGSDSSQETPLEAL